MSDPNANLSAAESMLAQAFQKFLQEQGSKDHRVDARDEEGDDNVQFVKNGWIRIKSDGVEHILRSAKFGQVKVLDTLLEANQDALTSFRQDILRQEAAEKARLATSEEMEEGEEKWKIQAEVAIKIRGLTREVRDKSDELRMAWWKKAFELLNSERTGEKGAKGAVPREWPGWVGDATLPTRAIAHWRSVPLGRG